jgi:hypothetical protein
MKRIIVICFFIRGILPLEAQEMLGFVNSNYAGVSALQINPASMVDSKLYLDINILSTGVFYQADMNKNAFANFRLNGPSFMINRGRHAFSINNAVRTAVSYRKTSSNSAYGNESNGEVVNVAGLAWGEIGLSYAYMFKRFERNVWSGGITLKPLAGGGGAFFAGFSNGFNLSTSITDNLNNSGLNSGGGGYGAGKGFGVDLGVVYQKKKRPVSLLTFKKLCQQKFQDYDYKVGISLIDVGSIRFTKKVNTGHFNQNLTNSLNGIIDSSDIQLVTDSNSYNASSSLQKENYSVKLPAALCIQFDYHYNKNWYFNGTFVQGITLSGSYVRRPTMLAVTPRFEKRWFEASLPVSVSDMKYFRLGLALRLWNFTIGSDNLLGSMGVGANAGFDIYTSVKINFAKGRCGKRKGGSMLDPFKQLMN